MKPRFKITKLYTMVHIIFSHCCISRSVVDPGGQKWHTKIEKKLIKFNFLKCWTFSNLRAEGFSCSLDVLYGGLGIKLQFLIKNILKTFSAVIFSSSIVVIKILDPDWIQIRIHIRIRIQLKCWIHNTNSHLLHITYLSARICQLRVTICILQ